MRVLDLFSGAGGAARGYAKAGFEVTGVDICPQPNYPYRFIQANALTFDPTGFDLIHASPPCQAHSDLRHRTKRHYPDLIAPTRAHLQAAHIPYIIENVESAPLQNPILLCGTQFPHIPLRVIRHRLFESNFPLSPPPHISPSAHPKVFTYDRRKAHYGKLDQNTAYVQVTGGGNCTLKNALDAMGLPPASMTKKEANEAIPPAYTEFIGWQAREYV